MQIAKSEYTDKYESYTVKLTQYDFLKDTKKLYLLIECVQSYINSCQNEYSNLKKGDEQYESDCRYFEKKLSELLDVRKSLFDIVNGLEG